MRRVLLFGFFLALLPARAAPSDAQVARDAANFHHFRTIELAAAARRSADKADSSDAMEWLAAQCRQLALRTSPDYIYGMVWDLIHDTSGMEESYLIAIMVLDNYPPDPARGVVRKIIADHKYKACDDVKNWLWEIDEAQKSRAKSKARPD
jgi:hypothetical protein